MMTARVVQLLGVTSLAAVERLQGAVAQSAGLEEVEASALVHLQAWPGASVGELAGVVGRSQPATVRLVDRLVEARLVRREPGPDRRTVALVVTEAGAEAANTVLTARARALAPMLAGFSQRDRATLERLLGKLTAGLTEDRPEAVHVCRLCDRGACRASPGCPLEPTATLGRPYPMRL
jgi:DNA-binding MarR family transcriptional regulator